jgi:hypothetical protein
MANRPCNPHQIGRSDPFDDQADGLHDHRSHRTTLMLSMVGLALAAFQVASCAGDPARPKVDSATDTGESMCGTPDLTLQTGNAAELFT